MKANAPEKIYIVDATFPDYVDFDGSPINTKKIDDHDIEYIRTDVFIEKAAEWMVSQASVYTVTHVSNDGSIYTYFYADKMVEDFRKYMKGE